MPAARRPLAAAAATIALLLRTAGAAIPSCYPTARCNGTCVSGMILSGVSATSPVCVYSPLSAACAGGAAGSYVCAVDPQASVSATSGAACFTRPDGCAAAGFCNAAAGELCAPQQSAVCNPNVMSAGGSPAVGYRCEAKCFATAATCAAACPRGRECARSPGLCSNAYACLPAPANCYVADATCGGACPFGTHCGADTLNQACSAAGGYACLPHPVRQWRATDGNASTIAWNAGAVTGNAMFDCYDAADCGGECVALYGAGAACARAAGMAYLAACMPPYTYRCVAAYMPPPYTTPPPGMGGTMYMGTPTPPAPLGLPPPPSPPLPPKPPKPPGPPSPPPGPPPSPVCVDTDPVTGACSDLRPHCFPRPGCNGDGCKADTTCVWSTTVCAAPGGYYCRADALPEDATLAQPHLGFVTTFAIGGAIILAFFWTGLALDAGADASVAAAHAAAAAERASAGGAPAEDIHATTWQAVAEAPEAPKAAKRSAPTPEPMQAEEAEDEVAAPAHAV